jgi:hypothetical protein
VAVEARRYQHDTSREKRSTTCEAAGSMTSRRLLSVDSMRSFLLPRTRQFLTPAMCASNTCHSDSRSASKFGGN